MKIISKRAKEQRPSIPEPLEVIESSVIIITSGGMSPDDIKRAEQIFRDIRKQLDDFGGIITP